MSSHTSTHTQDNTNKWTCCKSNDTHNCDEHAQNVADKIETCFYSEMFSEVDKKILFVFFLMRWANVFLSWTSSHQLHDAVKLINSMNQINEQHLQKVI